VFLNVFVTANAQIIQGYSKSLVCRLYCEENMAEAPDPGIVCSEVPTALCVFRLTYLGLRLGSGNFWWNWYL